MRIGILGGGLSGIVMAYLLQDKVENIDILEKEIQVGGLCRSFNLKDVTFDVGPHIIFSKNQEVLTLMVDMLGDNIVKLRRNNKIYFKGKFIKYPFENDLGSLPEEDKQYCVTRFLKNPYTFQTPTNMQQFFLTTFGEGITYSYLQPYNEKIWKYDPSFMDTQMVERVPIPPASDILRSANGIPTEGYQHQLYFYYPKQGGIQSLVKAFIDKLSQKVRIIPNSAVMNVIKQESTWIVRTPNQIRTYDYLISTIPIPELTDTLAHVPDGVREAVCDLKYNSLYTLAVNVKKDNLKDYLAVMVPDKDIIFHRVTKLNSLMPSDILTLLVEVTYHRGDLINLLSPRTLYQRVVSDLIKVGFIDSHEDYISAEVVSTKYAYVIYDLNHQKNMKIIREFYDKLGICLCGRFGEHRYLNMDTVIENCLEKVKTI